MKTSLVFRRTVTRRVLATDVTRFWSRVDKTGDCWIFLGGKSGKYVYFGIGPFNVGAHRFSYMLEHGSISENMVVMHLCDTPRCVNPQHLRLGTQTENMTDMRRKGRGFVLPPMLGEEHATSKLSAEDVIHIRKEHDGNYGTSRRLCRKFKVSDTTIANIIARRSWRHI